MRHAGREIEGFLQDLVGVGGDHIDAGKLLCRLDEGADCDALKSFRLSVLEQFSVGEGC